MPQAQTQTIADSKAPDGGDPATARQTRGRRRGTQTALTGPRGLDELLYGEKQQLGA